MPTDSFRPHPALTGGHRMTVFAWARSRRFPLLPPPEARLFRVAPDTQVLGHCHWQPSPRNTLTVILLHGLEGSSDSHYMRGMADKAFRRGLNVVRLNQRNCGGTEHLGPGLYHSGLTADPRAVMRELAERDGLDRFAVLGYSLGGNVALKLAGELDGDGAAPVIAVAAVSPPIELAQCVDALERLSNTAYHLNFLRGLRGRLRRKGALFPQVYDVARLARVRSVRAFDDVFTAPHNGFDGAADYYHRASAMRVLPRLAVPALLITAADDPFVPPTPREIRRSPASRTSHGSSRVTADTAGTSAVRLDPTTATGPSVRSWNSRRRTRRVNRVRAARASADRRRRLSRRPRA